MRHFEKDYPSFFERAISHAITQGSWEFETNSLVKAEHLVESFRIYKEKNPTLVEIARKGTKVVFSWKELN